MYVVITKDSNGAPAESYRGPVKGKALEHKAALLRQGRLGIVEWVGTEPEPAEPELAA